MSNFKDYIKDNNFNQDEKENLKKSAEDLVSRYAHMTANELEQTLLNEVARQKQNGTFDKNKLLYMLNSIKSMLSPETYNAIENALKNL